MSVSLSRCVVHDGSVLFVELLIDYIGRLVATSCIHVRAPIYDLRFDRIMVFWSIALPLCKHHWKGFTSANSRDTASTQNLPFNSENQCLVDHAFLGTVRRLLGKQLFSEFMWLFKGKPNSVSPLHPAHGGRQVSLEPCSQASLCRFGTLRFVCASVALRQLWALEFWYWARR